MKFPTNEVAPYLNEERHGKYAKFFSGPSVVIRSSKRFSTSLTNPHGSSHYELEWNHFDEEDADDNIGYITYAMYFTSGTDCFCPSPVNLSFGVLTAFEI